MKRYFIHVLLAIILFSLFICTSNAKQIHMPSTISNKAQDTLKNMGPGFLEIELPSPDDLSAWKKVQAGFEKDNGKWLKIYTEKYGCESKTKKIGGVDVFEIIPPGCGDNKKALIYLHGGGYVLLSPYSNLSFTFPIAAESGLRVFAVDYTLAPFADWHKITDEVIQVITALYDLGYHPQGIGIYGDSAGGGLSAGVVLKMRDKGIELPGALALISPWADITKTGDSYFTLEADDPFIVYNAAIKNSADAYALEKDQKNPVVSPVYGDYSMGFVPTIIQGGLKEIFLSNFVRLYQNMDQAGVKVTLDLYEGMWHDFIACDDLPESQTARKKIISFFNEHLGKKL